MNARMTFAVTALSALLLTTGCSRKQQATHNPDGSVTNPNGSVTFPANSSAAQQEEDQGTLQSDGTYAKNPDGSVTVPANSPAAQQETATNPPAQMPPPNQAQNQPTPPAPLTIPAGAAVPIRVNAAIDSKTAEVGTPFNGVLNAPIRVHGETVFRAGTPVSGEVVASRGKGRFKGAGDLGLELTAIGKERIHTAEYEKVDKGEGKRTGAFVGGGTGLGAILGGIAGGGRGALIGGLAGAGAGTAGAATGRRDVLIPAETPITFRLTEPVTR
jgi:hypothetical protein